MTGYSDETWAQVQAMYEQGISPAHIEQNDGMPTRQAIHQRAQKEGWTIIDQLDERFPFADDESLSPEQRTVIMKVAEGMPIVWASDIAGVDPSTVRRWRKKHPRFARLMRAGIAWKAGRRLGKIEDSKDWRAHLALMERDPDTREHFSPPNAAKGVMTNTFNVLGQVQLGFVRGEDADHRIPEERQLAAVAAAGRDGHEQEGL